MRLIPVPNVILFNNLRVFVLCHRLFSSGAFNLAAKFFEIFSWLMPRFSVGRQYRVICLGVLHSPTVAVNSLVQNFVTFNSASLVIYFRIQYANAAVDKVVDWDIAFGS